jgi:CDP-6-deoxy-D-xylo-4-hexulose-3-dehydrase
MKFESVSKLRGIIDLVLENESRVNEAKPIRYWYPLSLATYGTDEIIEALDSMCSFRTSMAEKTLQFERQFSNWQNSADAVMVNSGSSADLLLCLLMTNPLRPLIPPGSEIIIPAVTWPTQVWSAMMAGLKVKLVDVDPTTLNIDVEDLERSIGPETRAVFLVHLLGNPCDMDRIGDLAERHNLFILEDCCEAMGASWGGRKVGNFGVGAAYSFFFSHHMTCMEGGMVVVPDIEKAEHLRIMRAHGWTRNVDHSKYDLHLYPEIDPRYAFVNWGLNIRPTEVQAGFGIRQLEKVDMFGQRRAEIALRFNRMLDDSQWLSAPKVADKAAPSWLGLPVMVDKGAPFNRADLTAYLEDSGVETRPVVTGNLVRHPVARQLLAHTLDREYPGADEVHRHGFYIGLSPLIVDGVVDRLISTFATFLARYR